ncbi:hypothetical protein EBT31_04930 [bacterium]|nr:hypothetical protein [bacterium]
MSREDIIRLARDAGMTGLDSGGLLENFERFAALVAAAEREKVAAWMIAHLYATGHGDTTEDMLEELEWQIAEREREACAQVCKAEYAACWHQSAMAAAHAAQRIEQEIRARGG